MHLKPLPKLKALILAAALAFGGLTATTPTAQAQVPQGISYQGAARDASGAPIASQTIGVRLTVLADSPVGPAEYAETHTLATTNLGLFSLVIGTGNVQSGSFAGIGWAAGPRFLKVEIDPNGGSNYLTMGTSQLLAVPYALVADTVLKAPRNTINQLDDIADVAVTGATNGQVLSWNGAAWVPVGLPGGDGWGTQTAVSAGPLAGDGTPASPLTLSNGGATAGQVLKWDGTAWVAANDDISFAGGPLEVSPRISGNGSVGSPLDLAGQGATTGQVLKWNGTAWVPDADNTGSAYTAGTGIAIAGNTISGAYTAGAGIQITGASIVNTGDTNPTDDITTTTTAAGDVTGTFSNLSVQRLQGRTVANIAPSAGQVLQWSGLNSRWEPGTLLSSVIANGPLAGTGTAADPLRLNNGTATGQVLTWNGAYWSAQNPAASSVSTSGPLTGSGSVADPVRLGNGSSAGQVLTWSGSQWVAQSPVSNTGWGLTGNSGTTTSNFIGTTDNAGIIFRTNNVERARFSPAGVLSIGTTTPNAGTLFHVATGGQHAMYAETPFNSDQAAVIRANYTGVQNFNAKGVQSSAFPAFGYGIGGEFLGGSIGVYGYSSGGNFTASSTIGVYGEGIGNPGSGTRVGVYGTGVGGSFCIGVYGTTDLNTPATTRYAGYFEGPVGVTGNLLVNGTLSKAAGTFKIDHPQDPANKYLIHSFVESPDMMNVYNGNITTDANGLAVVELPAYFETLNRDVRYQLTPIGQFAQCMVKEKVSGNRFVIQTDKPNVEVS